jgi:acyl carrier protein
LQLKEAIRTYIGEELLEDDAPIGDDENLLADGMVDSIGMLRLIGFIEASYGVQVPLEDITIENFRSIEALSGYLTNVAGVADEMHDDA